MAEIKNNITEIKIPRRNILATIGYFVFWILLFSILAWAYTGADIRFIELFKYSNNILILMSGFFPPNFYDWQNYLSEMVVTIQIAVWGTFLAVVFSVPFGLLSSKNVTPEWLRQPVRRLMDIFRSVNEMIFALLFVASVGLGPFAGVLALFIHTLGTLAKLFSEAVEAIDPHPMEGIKATGATHVEEIIYGVIPQVMPLWISYSLYRFEANVRSATVIGMVGAGGIGLILWDAVRSFEYSSASAMLIIIIITVILLDLLSAKLRELFT
ncbi:MAG: phosphonate ABC transporter, permease protein PhnE [Spirochaetes bacterium]|nr:phosphonate ABC transporter, permease protein PhnE [Spirochaetota bacterium]